MNWFIKKENNVLIISIAQRQTNIKQPIENEQMAQQC